MDEMRGNFILKEEKTKRIPTRNTKTLEFFVRFFFLSSLKYRTIWKMAHHNRIKMIALAMMTSSEFADVFV